MQFSACLYAGIAASLLSTVSGVTAQQGGPGQIGQPLQRPVTVAWHGQQLGTALHRLAETQGIAIWLDRRVDPQQQIAAEFSQMPLQRVLERLAEQRSLGVAKLQGVVYFGPQPIARELATVVQQAHDSLAKVPAPTRQTWLRVEPSDWPRLSQPRTLLASLLDDNRIELVGAEQVSHDLWQTKRLPPLPLVDRVVLILAGFDLTCQIAPDGRTCKVVPIARPVVVSRQYEVPQNGPSLLRTLRKQLPESKFELRGRTLALEGTWEDHVKVRDLLAGRSTAGHAPSPPRLPKMTDQRFTLKIKNQAVGRVIGQLAGQLKLEVVWNEQSLSAAQRSPETLVSCDVKDVTLEELLRTVLAPAGMQFRREGKKIDIEAAR